MLRPLVGHWRHTRHYITTCMQSRQDITNHVRLYGDRANRRRGNRGNFGGHGGNDGSRRRRGRNGPREGYHQGESSPTSLAGMVLKRFDMKSADGSKRDDGSYDNGREESEEQMIGERNGGRRREGEEDEEEKPREKKSYYFIYGFLKQAMRQSQDQSENERKGNMYHRLPTSAEVKLLSLMSEFLEGHDPTAQGDAMFDTDEERSRGISLLMKQSWSNITHREDAFKLVSSMWRMVSDKWNEQREKGEELEGQPKLRLDEHMFVTVLLMYRREIEHLNKFTVGHRNAKNVQRIKALFEEARQAYDLYLQAREESTSKGRGMDGRSIVNKEEVIAEDNGTAMIFAKNSIGVFSATMLLCLRVNQQQSVFDVYNDMVQHSVLPDKVIFTHLFDASSQLVSNASSEAERIKHTETALSHYSRYQQLLQNQSSTYEERQSIQLDRIGAEAMLRSVMMDNAAFLNAFNDVCQHVEYESKNPVLTVNVYVLLLKFLLDNETSLYDTVQQPNEETVDETGTAKHGTARTSKHNLFSFSHDITLLEQLLPEDPTDIGITVTKHMQAMHVPITSVSIGRLIRVFADRNDYRAFVLLKYSETELRVHPNLQTFASLLNVMEILRKRNATTEEEIVYFAKRAVNSVKAILERNDERDDRILTRIPKHSLTGMIKIFGFAEQAIPEQLEQHVLRRISHEKIITWANAMLTVHCRLGEVDRAVQFIHAVKSNNLMPDEITVNIVAQHYDRDPGKFTPLKEALQEWGTSERGSIRLISDVEQAYTALINMRSEGREIKWNEYEHVIKLLGKKRDTRAFDVFRLSREDYPKSLNFRIYQALFTSFFSPKYEKSMWSVYEESYVKETDGRDPYPFRIMQKIVKPGSTRERHLQDDMKRLGISGI